MEGDTEVERAMAGEEEGQKNTKIEANEEQLTTKKNRNDEDQLRSRKGYHSEEMSDEDDTVEDTKVVITVDYTKEKRPRTPAEEDQGFIDTILNILVRIVLAAVWIAVALRWVLEKISDVLAALIEQCLAWMQPLQ